MPAITSVFVWMVAISYLLLAIVMDRTKKQSRLVFKDQDLNQARKRLKETLRRRLADMDGRYVHGLVTFIAYQMYMLRRDYVASGRQGLGP